MFIVVSSWLSVQRDQCSSLSLFMVGSICIGSLALSLYLLLLFPSHYPLTHHPLLHYPYPPTPLPPYPHPLSPGAFIDSVGSLRLKRSYLSSLYRQRSEEACRALGVLSIVNKLRVRRGHGVGVGVGQGQSKLQSQARGQGQGQEQGHEDVREYDSGRDLSGDDSGRDVSGRSLLLRSLSCLHRLDPTHLTAGPMRIHFIGETGTDAGGLGKDWVGLMARGLLGRGLYLLQLGVDGSKEVANLVSGVDSGRWLEVVSGVDSGRWVSGGDSCRWVSGVDSGRWASAWYAWLFANELSE